MAGERRAKRRTWTLGTLPRDRAYALFFNVDENRWDISELDEVTAGSLGLDYSAASAS